MMLAYLAANGVVDHKYLFPVGGDLQGGVQTKMGRSINSPRDLYHSYTRDLKGDISIEQSRLNGSQRTRSSVATTKIGVPIERPAPSSSR